MKRRGVMPVIACVVALGCTAGERAPTQTVRSSRAIVGPTHAHPPIVRRFKETMLFVPAGGRARDVPLTVDRKEGAQIFVLPPNGIDAIGAENVRRDVVFAPSLDEVHLGETAAASGVVVDVRMPSSPIEMALSASTLEAMADEHAWIDVALTDDGAPIRDATMEVTLRSPLDHARRTLSSMAVGPIDLVSVLRADDPMGAWTIEVRARGASRGVAFDRFGTIAVHFGRRRARIVDVGALRRADDGAIEADVRLDVQTHDRLEITGVLETTNGAAVAMANTTATFEPGGARTTLRFDREALTGPGPYVLGRVRVYSMGTHATVATTEGGGA